MAPADPTSDRSMRFDATRTSSLWTIVGVGAAIALLMLVFVAQNSESIEWRFLWFAFTMSGGLAVLFGMVIGALLVVAVGVARLLQMRLAARRHRHLDERFATPDPASVPDSTDPLAPDPASRPPA